MQSEVQELIELCFEIGAVRMDLANASLRGLEKRTDRCMRCVIAYPVGALRALQVGAYT